MIRHGDIKRAVALAVSKSMVLIPSKDNEELAHIYCPVCGWLKEAGNDVSIERYLKSPHGCHPCTWAAEHETKPARTKP